MTFKGTTEKEEITKRIDELCEELMLLRNKVDSVFKKVRSGDIFMLNNNKQELRLALFKDATDEGTRLIYLRSRQYSCGGTINFIKDSGNLTIDEYISKHPSYCLVGNIFDILGNNIL